MYNKIKMTLLLTAVYFALNFCISEQQLLNQQNSVQCFQCLNISKTNADCRIGQCQNRFCIAEISFSNPNTVIRVEKYCSSTPVFINKPSNGCFYDAPVNEYAKLMCQCDSHNYCNADWQTPISTSSKSIPADDSEQKAPEKTTKQQLLLSETQPQTIKCFHGSGQSASSSTCQGQYCYYAETPPATHQVYMRGCRRGIPNIGGQTLDPFPKAGLCFQLNKGITCMCNAKDCNRDIKNQIELPSKTMPLFDCINCTSFEEQDTTVGSSTCNNSCVGNYCVLNRFKKDGNWIRHQSCMNISQSLITYCMRIERSKESEIETVEHCMCADSYCNSKYVDNLERLTPIVSLNIDNSQEFNKIEL